MLWLVVPAVILGWAVFALLVALAIGRSVRRADEADHRARVTAGRHLVVVDDTP